MKQKKLNHITTASKITRNMLSPRASINPVRNLRPENLSRVLDTFHQGYLSHAALLWDEIERRDDVIQGVASKRKKAIAHLPWEILTIEDSPEAQSHKLALEYFYNNLTACHATDSHQRGGFSLLIKQMMDSVGKKYAVHEIVFEPHNLDELEPKLTASFHFVPLWHFESKQGKLHLRTAKNESIPLDPSSWLVTHGDGIMESSSIAYLFKHLPLRDWLTYCGRNGMPGIKGVTDAEPGTPEWEAARIAVQDFGAEFSAIMNRGTDIEAIDLTSKTQLPYPLLVERMDRTITALWRGSDLSTFSSNNASGASVQKEESNILLQDDASTLSETLNAQIDRPVLQKLFNVERGKAYIKINTQISNSIQN